MSTITSKAGVKPALQKILESSGGTADHLARKTHTVLLTKKIKFPVLEFCAQEFFTALPKSKHLSFLNKIISYHSIGGNVIAGKMLQLRLEKYFNQSLKKATEYMIEGDEWYVCDIIGERVMGHALLMYPQKTIPILKKYAQHKSAWIVRCIGVGGHYAIKNGLRKKYVEEFFHILLSLSNQTEFHTTRGIGWAAKTTAKFHPDIIRKFQKQLAGPEIRAWFHTKIKIGLGRSNKYAQRYTG